MTGFAPPPAAAPTMVDRHHESGVLIGLLDDVRGGRGGVVVIRGEAGIGKTVLLDYTAWTASDLRLVRVAGVESEMELAFAALHQFCAPMLDQLARLPSHSAMPWEPHWACAPDRHRINSSSAWRC